MEVEAVGGQKCEFLQFWWVWMRSLWVTETDLLGKHCDRRVRMTVWMVLDVLITVWVAWVVDSWRWRMLLVKSSIFEVLVGLDEVSLVD